MKSYSPFIATACVAVIAASGTLAARGEDKQPPASSRAVPQTKPAPGTESSGAKSRTRNKQGGFICVMCGGIGLHKSTCRLEPLKLPTKVIERSSQAKQSATGKTSPKANERVARRPYEYDHEYGLKTTKEKQSKKATPTQEGKP